MKIIRCSVFAIASLLCYFVSTIESGLIFSPFFKVQFYMNNQLEVIEIPGLNILTLFFFTIIAVKLYLHAWGIEESPCFKAIIKSRRIKSILFFEWIIRIFWVFLITYIPSVYTKSKIVIGGINIKWEAYFAIIFSLIFLWDLIMKNKIYETSYFVMKDWENKDEQLKTLKLFWFKFDIYLFAASILFLLINSLELKNSFYNIKPFAAFFVISIILTLSLLQIILWSTEILKGIKSLSQ